MRRFSIILPLILALLGCSPGEERSVVRLATTTSTYNSGLLQEILPPLEEREGMEIQILSVGTGQALYLGETGEVDILLVHARRREDEFVAEGFGTERRDVMWNDFVILGPPDDPAGLRGGNDAVAALRRITATGSLFISRGDDSGTHIREQELWAMAGGPPTDGNLYIEAGQGMGSCLIIADEKHAYLLSDRGTYLAFAARLDLQVLVENDLRLHNPYGAILVNPERHPMVHGEPARKLMDYLTSPEGQRRIGDFRVDGRRLFHPATGEN